MSNDPEMMKYMKISGDFLMFELFPLIIFRKTQKLIAWIWELSYFTWKFFEISFLSRFHSWMISALILNCHRL